MRRRWTMNGIILLLGSIAYIPALLIFSNRRLLLDVHITRYEYLHRKAPGLVDWTILEPTERTIVTVAIFLILFASNWLYTSDQRPTVRTLWLLFVPAIVTALSFVVGSIICQPFENLFWPTE